MMNRQIQVGKRKDFAFFLPELNFNSLKQFHKAKGVLYIFIDSGPQKQT